MSQAAAVNLLALDTTETGCSAALLYHGELTEQFELAPRRHSELVLPMMDHLLRDSGVTLGELDAIAFARGPGSFTGLRIAAAVAQGAALGAGLPVLAVSSLQALAQAICRNSGAKRVLVGLDARMNEVYWGAFNCDGANVPQPLVEEAVCAPDAVGVPDGSGWHAAGSAWAVYAESLKARVGEMLAVSAEAQVHAADVALVAVNEFVRGAAVSAEQALPVYLRDQVAWKKS